MNFIILKAGTKPGNIITTLSNHKIESSVFHNSNYSILRMSETPDSALKAKLESFEGVENIVEGPNYILASRALYPGHKKVMIGDTVFYEDGIVVIAGPCSVTDDNTLMPTALRVRAAGASLIRGGLYKPRTSPYVFQGMGKEGLHLVDEVEKAGMPFVSEVMGEDQIEILAPHISAFQVGARNMQNFNLLKALGKQKLPVVLKQGFGCTLVEFLNAAEYIMSGGNENVILVVRGIRTFEKATRFTLDIGSIAWLKKETRLPIIVDPSHAIGEASLIASGAKAAIAAGADGLMLEVHSNPSESPSDADQALSLDAFDALMIDIEKIANAVNKTIQRSPVVSLKELS